MGAITHVLRRSPELKNAAYVGMGAAGAIWRMGRGGRSADRTSELRILMYHRVSPRRVDTYTTSPERLRMHLRLVAASYQPITPATLLRAIEERLPLPDRAVLLTFDDGFLEHYEHAYPALRDAGLEALLFVPTDHIRERGDDRHAASIPYTPLDWTHLEEMRDVFTIGSHGMSHQKMTELPRATAEFEVSRSKQIIEERLGTPVSFFCYPFGTLTAYDSELEAVVRTAGYKASFVTIPGPNPDEQVWAGGALRRHGVEPLSRFALARVLDGSSDVVQGMIRTRRVPVEA
ncbi:MAG TPA: polysaccharide deacetylase family protein [Actinomycetota bacterium]|nr:polysaccharide deacetylase family protein [Actinomycetota bacterium]